MRNNLIAITAVFIVIAFTACNNERPKIIEALKLAGNNKDELQKAISYFKKKNDKFQLQSLYFLIENMPGKGWIEYKPYLNDGTAAPFYPFTYNDSIINKRKKQIEDSVGSKIEYNISAVYEDIKVIKASYLIENIELAFTAWQKPWAKHLSFDQFCEYLLPYRFGTEPITNWRKKAELSLHWVSDSLKGKSLNALNACTVINDSLKKRFKFKHDELLFYPHNLTYDEALQFRGGRCDDLNLIAAYWMRSIGIPVVNDFTPVWANSNFGGHTWLSVLTETNKNVPFNAAYDNPYIDSLPFKNDKLCKVYRRQYKKELSTFKMLFPSESQYPGFLFTDNYFDVTSEYVKAKDIQIPIILTENYNFPFAYLGVLSQTDWRIDGYGKVLNNQINFKNVGPNTIYIAFFQRKDTLQILSDPFLINNAGEVIYFRGDPNKKENVKINIKRDYWWLRKERNYILTFWDKKGWRDINPTFKWDNVKWVFSERSINISDDSMLVYKNLPSNRIYRFKNIDAIIDIGTFGRPFIITDSNYTHY